MADRATQAKAADAFFMGLERSQRAPSPKEVQKVRQAEAHERAQAATVAGSGWLLARAPGLRTPGGLACGIAIGALKGLRVQRPELTGDALLAAVLDYRNAKVRQWGAEDLVVDAGGRAA
jgi:hypothetical protein